MGCYPKFIVINNLASVGKTDSCQIRIREMVIWSL